MIGDKLINGGTTVLATIVIGIFVTLLMLATRLMCWIFSLPCFSVVMCFLFICFVVCVWMTILVFVLVCEIFGNLRQKYYDRKTKRKFY